MMDLSNLDDVTLIARGKYSSLNAEQKLLMGGMQHNTQAVCDLLRKALSEISGNESDVAVGRILEADGRIGQLRQQADMVIEISRQKQELYPDAWGKK